MISFLPERGDSLWIQTQGGVWMDFAFIEIHIQSHCVLLFTALEGHTEKKYSGTVHIFTGREVGVLSFCLCFGGFVQ